MVLHVRKRLRAERWVLPACFMPARTCACSRFLTGTACHLAWLFCERTILCCAPPIESFGAQSAIASGRHGWDRYYKNVQYPLEILGGQGPARARDPNAPKVNRTPFNFFSVEARAKAKAAFPDLSQSEISKKVQSESFSCWHGSHRATPYLVLSTFEDSHFFSEWDCAQHWGTILAFRGAVTRKSSAWIGESVVEQ